MSEVTCGNCRHWHRVEVQTPQRGVAILSGRDQPVIGQCRRELVALAMPNGQLISLYPQTAQQFPACGHYEAASE